jgi:hypothetical protein
MIEHHHTTIRPNSSVPFYTPPENLMFLRQEFAANGKILERNISISPDGCTRTVITKFESEEAFLEFFYSDAVQTSFLARRAYNLEKGIVERINFYDGEGNSYYIDNKVPE